MTTSNISVTEKVDATSNTSKNIAKAAVVDLQPMETFVLVWLSTNAEKITDITKLRCIVNYMRVFNDPNACIDYITNRRQEKVFVIVSSSVGEQIVLLIDQIDEIDSIYIYCPNEAECAALWAQSYRKVRGVFIDIDSICEQLNKNTRQCSNNLMPMSSIPSSSAFTNIANREQVSLMYSQLIRDLFLVLEHPIDQPCHSLREMILHFTVQFEGDDCGKALLEEIERDYNAVLTGDVNTVPQYKSIYWYTRCRFIFETLNKALRTQDIDMLFTMRFFIVDLHKQLQELHSSAAPASRMSMTVYRGQVMSSEEFEKHRSNIGGLLSINNFLSTSADKYVAELFADASTNEPGMEKILFEIEINPQIGKNCPFANIEHLSSFRTESEILISMGSVFRIRSVEKNISGVWNVDLKLTDEEDEQVEALTDGVWEKIRSDHNLLCLAKLMRLMGNYEKAEMFIDELMSATLFCRYLENLALVINEIGLIYEKKGDLTTATLYYQKFVEMKQKRQFIWSNYMFLSVDVTTKTLLNYLQNIESNSNQELNTLKKSFENEQNKEEPNREKLAFCCKQMGEIYEEQENDTDALRMYEESLKLFSSIDSSTIRTSSIIAFLHAKLGNTQASEKYIEQTLKERLHFRLNDREFVKSYEGIGLIYEIQERYPDAVKMYEKILAYPLDKNPNWNIVLPNIGYVYEKQGNYSASLQTYERLLSIQLDMFYRDHPLVADTYASIARLLDGQQKYKEAYTSLANALKIDLITMTPNHPWIKKRQVEIDLIRQKMVVESIS
ncbi:unnamed protein product [Didymodactylos carnosus]|uniref:NAD(P)(+)--arginine ADP-ribosyltransferase n=1 Tax=Didymodactylos carnosus TaxID=1234261 RepID=A0A814RI85_9BILA|nr:unnamed protein product [Didymodactylos carnosus]CAF3897512.1 unnamed protein product [Didymodactylos carnosus]